MYIGSIEEILLGSVFYMNLSNDINLDLEDAPGFRVSIQVFLLSDTLPVHC